MDEIVKPVQRKEFFTPDMAPLAVALGRLHKNKAFDTLLEAVARTSGLYLWIVGEGPERGALEAQAEKLGIKPRTRFLGWREDASTMLAAADFFVCPSRHEPLGNVVLESWAQSIPVLAADSLGPGTLIEHTVTGLLTPVDDVPAMARMLQLLVSNPQLRETLAIEGRKSFENHYTEASVVQKYLDFFQEIVG